MLLADLPPEPSFCIMQEVRYPHKNQQLACINDHLFVVWPGPESDALPVMKTEHSQMVCNCKAKTIDYNIPVLLLR